ncbi:MAG: NBR1-Ig-like domain-containing protein [Chloroflexi bacterium]|nr:NBR1-Ig-like domain-containing protein [Chloroflexota bacterium]
MKPIAMIRVFCITLLLAACRIGGSDNTEPVRVAITSPANNAIVPLGRPAQIEISAQAQAGVVRVELSVNGTLVAVSNNPTPTNQYHAVISYTPLNVGPLNVIVRAYDKDNTASAPVGLALQVMADSNPGTSATGTVTEPTVQTPQATDTSVPGVNGPGGCVMNAQFIADVTVPDGSTIPLGSDFIKTWRVLNSGTCSWDNNYRLVFSAGSQLGAPGSVSLKPTQPGDITDISVPMQAPGSGTGTFAGEWRFASPDNTIFGNKLTVVIALPPPPATATPTPAPPTATPTPTISFTSDTSTLARGNCTMLRWTSSNVAGVYLDGIGVPSPAEKAVCPTETTTYTLKINFNDGSDSTQQVVISVREPIIVFSFSASAPSARWRNDAGESLSFGGPEGDGRGFAISRDGAALEDDSTRTKVLETHPRGAADGSILGEYDVSAIIQSGDMFRTHVGFLKSAGTGTVTLRLWFQDVVVGETVKSYDQTLKEWTVDLSRFAGQSGRFTLQAVNSAATSQGPICWINPRIER